MPEMISLEQAQEIVLSHVDPMPVERVSVLDVVGRVAAEDATSDIDIAPFAHSAMDGFAVHAADIAAASTSAPAKLEVIAEIGAGAVFEGSMASGQCVRIMTGAPLPADADSVVKYEIVDVVQGGGGTGSTVSFSAPTDVRSNVREAGEEARAGEVIMTTGEVVTSAGVGFLASCGILEIATYARPQVAVIATGSELVDPSEVPAAGKIRDSNSYAMAACARQAGAVAHIHPAVEDSREALEEVVRDAAESYDFVVTTGGAGGGDFDFIKSVVDDLGELLMTSVNMRPGKAQTFGLVHGVPVFGLPGNPAAAYCGFEMIIRPALRKMQGYRTFDRPRVVARLSKDVRKRDPRRILLRSTLTREEDGSYAVTPARNQSSGLFGVIQRSNCMAVIPEGTESKAAGDEVECILLDVPEEALVPSAAPNPEE